MLTTDEIKEVIQTQPPQGVIISESGKEIFRNPPLSRRFLVHSVAKSVTALGVGFAIQEGLLDPEETLAGAFPDKVSLAVSRIEAARGSEAAHRQLEGLKQIRLRHLLSQTSGFQHNFLTGFQRPYLKDDDWLTQCLSIPVTSRPGEVFMYCDALYYLIAKLLRRRTGLCLTEYLMPRLFEPLQIRYPTWEVDPDGDMIGCGGLLMNLDELHKLGHLCLNRGKVNGRRVVPEEWIMAVTDRKVSLAEGGGYGYGFWTAPDYCCMFGYGGVYNIISYSQSLVITADGLDLPFPAQFS